MQYFLMAAFCWMLIEGIYLYLFVVKVYNINTKIYMYHVISWGEFFNFFQTCTGNCNNVFGSPNLVFSRSRSVSISFLSLWVGLPVIMVAISLGIAAGKEGLQSYTSDK